MHGLFTDTMFYDLYYKQNSAYMESLSLMNYDMYDSILPINKAFPEISYMSLKHLEFLREYRP